MLYLWKRQPKAHVLKFPVDTFVRHQCRWVNANAAVPVQVGTGAGLSIAAAWQHWERYWEGQWREWALEASAIVPIVPAGLHPGPALSNYHILWDAVWTPEPPRDPLLLKHLAGSLYAIVAHWDLSPLERAVLAGRL